VTPADHEVLPPKTTRRALDGSRAGPTPPSTILSIVAGVTASSPWALLALIPHVAEGSFFLAALVGAALALPIGGLGAAYARKSGTDHTVLLPALTLLGIHFEIWLVITSIYQFQPYCPRGISNLCVLALLLVWVCVYMLFGTWAALIIGVRATGKIISSRGAG